MNLLIFQPQVGRADLQRKAFAQGRQAFRRALAAVPEKLLLKQRQVGFGQLGTVEALVFSLLASNGWGILGKP